MSTACRVLTLSKPGAGLQEKEGFSIPASVGTMFEVGVNVENFRMILERVSCH
jgi:hypothetical protein